MIRLFRFAATAVALFVMVLYLGWLASIGGAQDSDTTFEHLDLYAVPGSVAAVLNP